MLVYNCKLVNQNRIER